MRVTGEARARFARLQDAVQARDADDAIAVRALASAQDVPPLCDQLDAANLALSREIERGDELQRRINGALRVIDRAGLSPTPGATGAILTSVRLVLESGRDRQEAQP